MRAKEFIVEKLSPSEYRNLVKGWDKTRYASIFDNKYRLYFPITNTAKNKIQPNSLVTAEVQSAGYQIDDYVSGIASSPDGKRKIKIGKLLKNPAAIKAFSNDPVRAAGKSKNQFMVISRHPYDIAGMSTDRGWTSCMNLKDGVRREYVPIDIKEGSLVAYLIEEDDININHPIARTLIKPFVNINNSTEVAFGIEKKVYGTASPAFLAAVVKWANGINASRKLDGIFILNPKLYHDDDIEDDDLIDAPTPSSRYRYYGPNAASYKNAVKNPISFLRANPEAPHVLQMAAVSRNGLAIQFIENPSDDLKITAVRSNGMAIQFIENPSHDVQLAAIASRRPAIQFIENPSHDVQIAAVSPGYDVMMGSEDVAAISYIKNPSIDVQMAAVTRNGKTLAFIKDPSYPVQMAAVSRTGGSIRFIDNPDEDLQLAAVSSDGNALEYINNPSPEVQMAAFNRHKSAIRFIEQPTPSMKLAAVKDSAFNIQYIKNPSNQVKLAAIEEDWFVIQWIKNPTVDMQLAAVRQNKNAINYIDNPAPEVQKFVAGKE